MSTQEKVDKFKSTFGLDSQSLGKDGVHVFGRLCSFGGVFCIALYTAAVVTFEWSVTPQVNGNEVNGLSEFQGATFGVIEYCLQRNLAAFNNDSHYVCFTYEDDVHIRQPPGAPSAWVNGTGCDAERFHSELCTRRIVAMAFIAIAITFCWIGDIYSEKVKLNAVMLLLAGLTGAVSMGAWLEFQYNAFTDGDGDGMEYGLSMILAGVATAMAFFSSLLGALDGFCIEGRRLMCDCDDDGIGYTGRFGAILSTLTWSLFLVGLAQYEWSVTTNIGAAGGFCPLNTNGTTECYGATIGIWKYCLNVPLEEFGGAVYPVCFEWDTPVQMPHEGFSATGLERFAAYDAGSKRTATAGTMIACIALICIGDAFSEKLSFCAIVNLLAALIAGGALGAWVTFQRELAMDTGALVEFGQTGFILLGAWFLAWLTTIFYFTDWKCNLDDRLEKMLSRGKPAAAGGSETYDLGAGEGSGGLELDDALEEATI